MLKLKTRKAVSKRYKKTSSSSFLRKHAYTGHLLMKKTNKQKRKLSMNTLVSKADNKSLKLMLPY